MKDAKVVLWALDIDPTPYMVEKLSEALGSEVHVVGVGRVQKACELLAALHDTGAEAAVIDMDSTCEVEKLLKREVDLLVPLFEEVRECPRGEVCRWDPVLEVTVEEEDGVRVLRFTGYGRITDVLFELEELDGHLHGHGHSHEHGHSHGHGEN